jgi:vesicle coat complex subunit
VISEILKSWLMLVNSETAYTLRNAFFAIVSRFEYSKDLR